MLKDRNLKRKQKLFKFCKENKISGCFFFKLILVTYYEKNVYKKYNFLTRYNNL